MGANRRTPPHPKNSGPDALKAALNPKPERLLTMGVIKGEDTKRQAPPHPENSGREALKAGIKALDQNYAESKDAPDRKGQSVKPS